MPIHPIGMFFVDSYRKTLENAVVSKDFVAGAEGLEFILGLYLHVLANAGKCYNIRVLKLSMLSCNG
jgi:hypothetical protein